MPLTLNQFLGLVLTLIAVMVATWLVIFLRQLKKTAEEAERTLSELRHNLQEFNELQAIVREKVESVSDTIEYSKKVVSNLADILSFFAIRVVRPASNYWLLIFPILRFLWRQKKKRKEKTHG